YQTDNYYPKLSNKQQLVVNLNSNNVDTSNSLLYKEFSQIIQNFVKVDIKEIGPTTQNINETIIEDLSNIIDELVNLYFEELNNGKEEKIIKQLVPNYFNNHEIILSEIYNWLQNNQTSSNSIYLLAYFNYHGIVTNINKKNAFKLCQKAAELENILAQYDLSNMYIDGEGTDKNFNKAFELSKKLTKGKY